MYSTWGATKSTETFTDLSFQSTGAWPIRLDDMANTSVKIGDPVCGPIIGPVACVPGTVAPPADAHGHASDNFRIILRGGFQMGREVYGPGEFRLQEGWKPYPGEDVVGDDGIWLAVMMADRRGFRGRHVKPYPPDSPEAVMEVETHRYLATTYELNGDAWYSDDPNDTAGESALVSTLGDPTNSGKLNGSFSDGDSWTEVAPGSRASVALLGEPSCGPVLVLSSTGPHGVVMPRCWFGTELFRMVVAGSCEIGGHEYEKGDMRVDRASQWCEPLVAGPDGLDLVLVIGDRRHAAPQLDAGTADHWLGSMIEDLLSDLRDRSTATA